MKYSELACDTYLDFLKNISENLGALDSENILYRLYYINKTTNLKLFDAKYHFERMKKIFEETKFCTEEDQNIFFAEVDSFFNSLRNVFDLLSQEINIVFLNSSFNEENVNISSIFNYNLSNNESEVELVKLKEVFSDELKKTWFADFKLYRDVTSHRIRPLKQVSLTFGAIGKIPTYDIFIKKNTDLLRFYSHSELLEEYSNLFGISWVENHYREIMIRDNPTDIRPGRGVYNREIFTTCLNYYLLTKGFLKNIYPYFDKQIKIISK
jgi:hypothetical protein